MAKGRLLLVVGAGASVEFGMPSVAECGAIISQEAQQFYPLADTPCTNLFAHVEATVAQYWRNHVPAHLYRDPQFEDILYVLFALAAAYPAGAYTSALGALIDARKLPEIKFCGRERQSIGADQLRGLAHASVDVLLSAFRERCRAAERDKAKEFALLVSLMEALLAEFEIAVVTLNYDNLVYRALGIETGFDPTTSRFDQDRILARTHWPCMLHLHGSVHFDMRLSANDLHEIHWQPDLNARFNQNASGRSSPSTPEGASFPTSAIVAGYGKTTQILRRLLRTYYSELERLVASCNAVLFAGYGFGDPHLNMAFAAFRDSRRRPVAHIGFARDDVVTAGSFDIGDNNPTATAILRVFQTDCRTMRHLGHVAPDTVAELKAAREFEISEDPNTPLSIWYNGMLAACAEPAKVIARLR